MKKIYTCIDIGTDTIRILVSEYYDKKFRTLAVSSVRSKGIKRGVIVDESLVLERLKLALDDISSRINIPIKKAVITIPAYNAEKHIENCLDSVLNQVNLESEIIIVNDASTDQTSKIISLSALKFT